MSSGTLPERLGRLEHVVRNRQGDFHAEVMPPYDNGHQLRQQKVNSQTRAFPPHGTTTACCPRQWVPATAACRFRRTLVLSCQSGGHRLVLERRCILVRTGGRIPPLSRSMCRHAQRTDGGLTRLARLQVSFRRHGDDACLTSPDRSGRCPNSAEYGRTRSLCHPA